MSISESNVQQIDLFAEIESQLAKLETDLNKSSDPASRAAIREDVRNLNASFSRAVMKDQNAEGLEKLSELTQKFTLKNSVITDVNNKIKSSNDTASPSWWRKIILFITGKEAPKLEEGIRPLVSEKDISKILFGKFEDIIEAKIKKEQQDIKLTAKTTRDATCFSIELSENDRTIKKLSFNVGDKGYLVNDIQATTIKELLHTAIQIIEEEKNVQASLELLKGFFESVGYPKETAADALLAAKAHLIQASTEEPDNPHLYSLAKTGDSTFTLFMLPINGKTGDVARSEFEITGEGKLRSMMTNQEFTFDELQKSYELEKTAFESLIETREKHTRESAHFNNDCKTKEAADDLLKEMHKLNKTEGYYFTWQDEVGTYYLAAISKNGQASHSTLSFDTPLGSIHFTPTTKGKSETKTTIAEFAKEKGCTASLSSYNRQKLVDDMKDFIDPRKGLALQTRANDAISQMDSGARYALLSTDSDTPQNARQVTVTIMERKDHWFGRAPTIEMTTNTFLITDNGLIVAGDMQLSFDQFKRRFLEGAKPFELDEAYAGLEDATREAGFPITSREQKMQFYQDIQNVLGNERFLEQPALMLYSQNGQLQLSFTNAEGKLVEATVVLKNNNLEVTLPGWLGTQMGAQTKTYSTFALLLRDNELFPKGAPIPITSYQNDIALRKEIMQMVTTHQSAPADFARYAETLGEKADGAFAFYTSPRPGSTLKNELHLAYISGGKVQDTVFDTTSSKAFKELQSLISTGKKEPAAIEQALIKNSPVKDVKPMLDSVKADYEKVQKTYNDLRAQAEKIYASGKVNEEKAQAALEAIVSKFPDNAVGAYALQQQEGSIQGKLVALVVEKDKKIHRYEIDLIKEPGRIATKGKPSQDSAAQLATALGFKRSIDSFKVEYEKEKEQRDKILQDYRANVNISQLQARAAALDGVTSFWCISQRPGTGGNLFILAFKKGDKGFEQVEHEFTTAPNKEQVEKAVKDLVGDDAITATEVETRFQLQQKQQENRKKELDRAKEEEEKKEQTQTVASAPELARKEPVAQPKRTEEAAAPSASTEKPAAAPQATAAEKSIHEKTARAIVIPGSNMAANLSFLQNKGNKGKIDAIITAKDKAACQVLLGRIQGKDMPAVTKGFTTYRESVAILIKDSDEKSKKLFEDLYAIAQGKEPTS